MKRDSKRPIIEVGEFEYKLMPMEGQTWADVQNTLNRMSGEGWRFVSIVQAKTLSDSFETRQHGVFERVVETQTEDK